MAVAKKVNKPTTKVLKEMKEAFLEQAGKLWNKHIEEASDILADAEEPKIDLRFGVELNFKESTSKLKTRLSFTKSYSDELVEKFDDPNQLPLGKVADEAKGK